MRTLGADRLGNEAAGGYENGGGPDQTTDRNGGYPAEVKGGGARVQRYPVQQRLLPPRQRAIRTRTGGGRKRTDGCIGEWLYQE